MKCIALIFAMVVCTKAAFNPEFKEKALKKIQEIGAGCAEKEKASGDDISELLGKQMPTRKEGKCLISCFYQNIGAQTEDGKFTKESVEKSIEIFKKEDEETYGKIKTAWDKCLPQVKETGDRCENAVQMAECATKVCAELGLTEEIFM